MRRASPRTMQPFPPGWSAIPRGLGISFYIFRRSHFEHHVGTSGDSIAQTDCRSLPMTTFQTTSTLMSVCRVEAHVNRHVTGTFEEWSAAAAITSPQASCAGCPQCCIGHLSKSEACRLLLIGPWLPSNRKVPQAAKDNHDELS